MRRSGNRVPYPYRELPIRRALLLRAGQHLQQQEAGPVLQIGIPNHVRKNHLPIPDKMKKPDAAAYKSVTTSGPKA